MADQVGYAGQQVGNYWLVRLLGLGGFAEVYLGEHVHLKTQAAVKLLHTRLASDDIEGFRREAQTIARLVHPHIVRVLDFGVEGNAPYLVMDYAPHGTLRNRYPKGTRAPLPEVVQYVRQVAEALDFAHEQRLIHRDIKPENMLVGRGGEILLSDFGIALASQSSSYQHTQDVAGTIAYMAPEQIQAHPRPASDQYALGIVIYEWLSGNRPFQGTYTEVAIKHTMAPPPPLRGQVPDLPPAVEDVVARALHKDPRQRFEDVRSLAMALEQASFMRSQFVGVGHTALQGSVPTSSQLSSFPTSVFSRSNAQPVAPYAGMPGTQPSSPYSVAAPPLQSARRISRRAIVGGLLLAAAGGGATFYLLNHIAFSQNAGNPTRTGGITSSGNSSNSFPSGATPGTTPLVAYKGHSDFIWAVAWSPNGMYIASSSKDGTTQVWDASTGNMLLSTRSHITPAMSDDWANSVSWSPTSRQVVSGYLDGTAEALDLTSRKLVEKFSGQSGAAQAVGWSPNGKFVAVGRTDDSIVIYNATDGHPLVTYTGHNDFVKTLAWSHDGTRIASGSSDGTAQVWRASDGKTLLKYTGHQGDILSVSWSPDDSQIVSGANDSTAQVWDSVTGHTTATYTGITYGIVNAVAWSHHSSRIAAGGNDVYTHIFDARAGKLLNKVHSLQIFGVAWSPDDARIVTASYRKTAEVWRV